MDFEFSLWRRCSAARPSSRRARCEALEARIALTGSATAVEQVEDIITPLAMEHDPHAGHTMYPGGVMVTPTEIHTHQEIIPRFAAQPTIVTVRPGNWDDPAVWSAGHVPRDGDRVSIGAMHTVLLTSQNSARIDALEISGTLAFAPQRDTRLIVANLLVMPEGALRIGSAAAPVAPNVSAEIVIADKPLDLVKDPRQFGTGLIVLGQVTIHGAEMSQTWQRLAVAPKAGNRFLTLSQAVTNWQPGDTLVLPDSRQITASQAKAFDAGNVPPEWEEVVIRAVYGKLVVLAEPLKFDHPGFLNLEDQLEFIPHVAALDRNVVIRSENPQGTRGHTLYTARADVRIAYAEFRDLGRTDALRPVDSTKFDAAGNVTHLGTNQIGRYAVHLHHVMGLENPTNTGYQFEFTGNSIRSSKKWGLALHGASFGLVDRNVVYDAQGSGIVTEDGTEIGNRISDNITIRMQGTHVDGSEGTLENDFGRGGVGFWFRRGGNIISGNVAVNNTYAGFVFSGYNLTPGRLPLFRGADLHAPEESRNGALTPATIMVDNEAYGQTPIGLWAAFVNGSNLLEEQPLTLIEDFRLWHIHAFGVVTYHTANLTFNRLSILGSMAARDRNDTGPMGMDLRIYENLNTVITNSRVEGMYVGISTPANDASHFGTGAPTVISNSVLRNYINLQVIPPQEGLPTATNEIEVRNVKFEIVSRVPNWPAAPDAIRPPANIYMTLTPGRFIDYTRPSIVRVYDYNQVPGDNFQVFYNEQVAGYVLPKTNLEVIGTRDRANLGVPEEGLTNAQSWARYGLAMGGGVVPSSATTKPDIVGLVAPIQSPPVLPRVVFVTPWDDAVTSTGYVRIRYNIIGQLPAGARVFVQLDNQPPISELPKDGLYNITPGRHQLRVYIGDADGKPLPGTVGDTTRFTSVWLS